MRKWLWNITWIIFRPALMFFCHFKISGAQKLKNLKAPFIMAIGVHSTYIDGFIVGSAFPFGSEFFPIRYMVKKRFVEMPMVGAIIKAYGSFLVEQGVGFDKSLEQAENFLKNKETVGIFPEGRFSKTGELQDGKFGTAYLSIKKNLPILPVALSGAYGLSAINFLLRKRFISVSFGDLIYPDKLGYIYKQNPGISEASLSEYSGLIMGKIKEML